MKVWLERLALFALLALLGLGGTMAQATPSTLVWIPSTDLQAEKTFHLGQDNYFPHEGSSVLDLGLTYGIKNAEVGIDYLSPGDDPLFFNAKVLLTDETKAAPRLVLGGFGFGTDSTTNANIVYLLGSKSLPGGPRLTLGYGRGRKAALGPDNNMLFAGLDMAFSDKWWGAVDYQSGDSAFGALSAGVAYAFSETTGFILGYDWYNASGMPGTVTAQLDLNF